MSIDLGNLDCSSCNSSSATCVPAKVRSWSARIRHLPPAARLRAVKGFRCLGLRSLGIMVQGFRVLGFTRGFRT